MKTRKEVAELAVLLGQRNLNKNPSHVTRDTLLICRVASTANRIATELCNGVIEQDRFDSKKESLCKRLRPLCPEYSIEFEIGGDPRGYVLKMFAHGGKPIHGNTWGGDESGYGI